MDSSVETTDKFLKKNIIIVGAGISGLACANRLEEIGFKSVTVYEAKSNVGGRMQTINFGSYFIEMGAQWIHGEDGNIIHQLASSSNLIDSSAPDYLPSLMSFSNLLDYEECKIVCELLKYLEECVSNPIGSNNYVDQSVLSCIEYHFDEFVSEPRHLPHKKCLSQVYDWYCKLLCELNGCTDLSAVSRHLLKYYWECDGSQAVELKNGCSSILTLLLEKISPHQLVKNMAVTAINWKDFKNLDSDFSTKESEMSYDCIDNNQQIYVHFENNECRTCDHVIVTVPLGCLKKNTIRFSPQLEARRLLTIESLGFDVVNKIFLEFEEPFWESPTIFNVLWEEYYDEIFENLEKRILGSKILWEKYINRFAYVPGHPKMLCAWIVGKGAELMESLSDESVSNGCLKLLELLLNIEVPKPCTIIRTSWMTDPYTYGSYSYLSVENEANSTSHKDLSEPEFSTVVSCSKHPVIQFAGEATHPHHFSTMHGAYESGIFEANRLLKHYQDYSINLEANYLDIYNLVPYHYASNYTKQKTIRNYLRIVVIGAGLAGLTCGLSLLQADFIQVQILEAQSMVGGRISSINYRDGFVELGASWLHGNNNSLYSFSKEYDLLSDISDNPSYEGEGFFCTSNGDIVDAAIVTEVKDVLNSIKAKLDNGEYKQSEFSNCASETFMLAFQSYLTSCNNFSNNSVKWGLFKWFLKFETIDNGCDNLDEVGIQSYADWLDCSENMYHINYSNGFQSLIGIIMKQIPKGVIKLNQPVRSIKWNNKLLLSESLLTRNRENKEYPICIQCDNGEFIYADSVIITASIGFLKENINTFFDPLLPEQKAQTLCSLGYGTINKIYLIFEKPFWNPDDLGFQLIWISEADEESQILLKENPWINGITGFDVVRKQPNMLLGWIGGEEAKMVEKVDDLTVKNVCAKLLKIFLKREDIQIPKEILRSFWYSNSYIRGAYSFRSVNFYKSGYTLEDINPLYCTYITEKKKEIQWPIIIFSGEATDRCSFSSVHGAFQSGLKATEYLSQACAEIGTP